MSKRLMEKLATMSKEVSADEHGVLKKLLNKVIFENNLESKLGFLVNRYERRNDSSKKKTKTVVVNELTSTRISFKNFIFLLFEVLNAKRIKLTVEVEFDRKTTKHSVDIIPESLGKKDNDESGKKDDDE